MDTKKWASLLAAVESGSFTRAARQLDITQSGLTHMMNALERETGFPFLNRINGGKTGGSSTLTDEGRLFIRRYASMIEEVEQAGQRIFDVYFHDVQ